MTTAHKSLIEGMAADLAPVRAFDFRQGAILTGISALATIATVAMFDGLWHGALSGKADPLFFIVNGMLLVLGAAAAAATIRIASPAVGNRYDGLRWGLAMLAVLPAVALMTLIAADGAHSVMSDPYGLSCMTSGFVASSAVMLALIVWLRRGAPVQIERAGMFAGVAAGAIGSFAYGLSCPVDGLGHLAIWHVAPVAIGAIFGRFALPLLLRW